MANANITVYFEGLPVARALTANSVQMMQALEDIVERTDDPVIKYIARTALEQSRDRMIEALKQT